MHIHVLGAGAGGVGGGSWRGGISPPRNQLSCLLCSYCYDGNLVFIVFPAFLAVSMMKTKSERIALEADGAMIGP